MTPEERLKIYEEEKARIESQKAATRPAPQAQKGPEATTTFLLLLLAVVGIGWVYLQMLSNPSQPAKQSAPDASPSPPAAAEVKLQLLSRRGTEGSGYSKVNGQVKNISPAALKNVEAVVSFFTKTGDFVKSDSALIDYNPILPGQTSPFEVITTTNPEISNFRVEFKTFMDGTIKTEDLSKKK